MQENHHVLPRVEYILVSQDVVESSYLGGRTDNVGGFNANMALSENRRHAIEPASGPGLMKFS